MLAIVASIVDHLRHSYSPLNVALVKSPEGHWHTIAPAPGARTADGIVVYRFGVDYTASTVLTKVAEHLRRRQVRLVFTSVLGPVRQQLDRYGISPDASYDTPGEALEAFRTAGGPVGDRPR